MLDGLRSHVTFNSHYYSLASMVVTIFGFGSPGREIRTVMTVATAIA